MWANEQEAAVLSGFSPVRYRQMLPALESRGFPPVNPLNGLRPIPAILAFWKLPANDLTIIENQAADTPAAERDKENWNGPSHRQRLAS